MPAIMKKAVSLALLTFSSLLGSTSAVPQFGPGPVVIPFQLRVYNPLTSEIAAPFLTCSGSTTRNISLAGNYYHFTLPPSAGELRCGGPADKLIGAPANASTAVFRGFEAPGSINTAFSIGNNDVLQWKNPSFEGGKAKFYQLGGIDDGKVFARFKAVPAGDDGAVTLVVQTPNNKS